MEGLAGLASLALGIGAAVSAATGDRRLAVLGLTVALLAAPFVALPWPALLPLAFREVAALTSMFLLWLAVREGRFAYRPTALDAALFVIAAFAAAALLAPAFGPARGPAGAFAGAAASALAAIALARGGAHERGLAAVFIVLSGTLVAAALAAAPMELDQAVTGATLLAVAGAGAMIADRGVTAGDRATSGGGPGASASDPGASASDRPATA